MCNFLTREAERMCNTTVDCLFVVASILTLLVGAVFIYSHLEYEEEPEDEKNVSYSQFDLSEKEENSYFMGATEEYIN